MEVMEGTSNVCEKRNSRLEVNVLYADTFSMFSSKEKGGRRSREEEITPQCTESNARPRKRTAHGNISRTELPQTQHSLAASVEGPPPSKTSYKSQNGEGVGEIEPNLAYWYNLTKKGRSSRGDDHIG